MRQYVIDVKLYIDAVDEAEAEMIARQNMASTSARITEFNIFDAEELSQTT